MEANHKTTLQETLRLKEILLEKATYAPEDSSHIDKEYENLRSSLIKDQSVLSRLPEFVRNCRNLEEFSRFIKNQSPTYKERREVLDEFFSSVLEYLEFSGSFNGIILPESLLSVKQIQDALQKCMERKDNDPDGALTSARALLEAGLKFILDEENIEYSQSIELPDLHKLAVKSIKFSNSPEDQALKQILGGCTSIVRGVATLRNQLGDAHGKGKDAAYAEPHEAGFSIAVTCAVLEYLILARKKGKRS